MTKEDVLAAFLAATCAQRITPGPEDGARGSQNIGTFEQTSPTDARNLDATTIAQIGLRYVTGQIVSLLGGQGLKFAGEQASIRELGLKIGQPHTETAVAVTTLLVENAFKVGNCGELAYAAYLYLRRNPCKAKVNLVSLTDKSGDLVHALVILGNLSRSELQVFSLDDEDVVICDPWIGRMAAFKGRPISEHRGVFADVNGCNVPGLWGYEQALQPLHWDDATIKVLLSNGQ